MKLHLVSLFPEHLNLNGDQANILIMRKRLEWAGHEVEVSSVGFGDDIPGTTDFLLLGHGSMAAWNEIANEIERLGPQLQSAIQSDVAFLAVASGYEHAIELGFFEGSLQATERTSKFELVEFEGLEILGYLNAASEAPVFQKKSRSIGTQLHGPVFAKNPKLVDAYLAEITNGEYATNVESEKIQELETIIDSLWELEKDLAGE